MVPLSIDISECTAIRIALAELVATIRHDAVDHDPHIVATELMHAYMMMDDDMIPLLYLPWRIGRSAMYVTTSSLLANDIVQDMLTVHDNTIAAISSHSTLLSSSCSLLRYQLSGMVRMPLPVTYIPHRKRGSRYRKEMDLSSYRQPSSLWHNILLHHICTMKEPLPLPTIARAAKQSLTIGEAPFKSTYVSPLDTLLGLSLVQRLIADGIPLDHNHVMIDMSDGHTMIGRYRSALDILIEGKASVGIIEWACEHGCNPYEIDRPWLPSYTPRASSVGSSSNGDTKRSSSGSDSIISDPSPVYISSRLITPRAHAPVHWDDDPHHTTPTTATPVALSAPSHPPCDWHRQLDIGWCIDARCSQGRWQTATIVDKKCSHSSSCIPVMIAAHDDHGTHDGTQSSSSSSGVVDDLAMLQSMQVMIGYGGYGSSWNEWLDLQSSRIVPSGSNGYYIGQTPYQRAQARSFANGLFTPTLITDALTHGYNTWLAKCTTWRNYVMTTTGIMTTPLIDLMMAYHDVFIRSID